MDSVNFEFRGIYLCISDGRIGLYDRFTKKIDFSPNWLWSPIKRIEVGAATVEYLHGDLSFCQRDEMNLNSRTAYMCMRR